jgi:hypothetical protein
MTICSRRQGSAFGQEQTMTQYIKQSDAPPSPPSYGALIAGLILAAIAVLLTYTLFPLPGQMALGDWNYALAAGLVLSAIVLAKLWVPTPWIQQDESFRPRVKAPKSRNGEPARA